MTRKRIEALADELDAAAGLRPEIDRLDQRGPARMQPSRHPTWAGTSSTITLLTHVLTDREGNSWPSLSFARTTRPRQKPSGVGA